MKYYKLTDQSNRTTNDTLWGEDVTHEAKGAGNKLCTSDVIHVYDHPLKAVMFNPIHAIITDPVLWSCKVRKVVANDGLKVGVKQCTTVKRLPMPEITTNQRIRFAILCALEVGTDNVFATWAENWLSGKDRSEEAAWEASWEASWEAAWAAAWAARVAGAAWEWEASWEAAWAAEAARALAEEAAWSAEEAIDFLALMKKAIKDEEKENES